MNFSWIVLIICCICCSVSATVNKIPVTAEEVTNTSVSFTGHVLSMIPHPATPNVIVVTTYCAVWTLDILSMTKTLIAGSTGSTRSYSENSGSSALFNYIYGAAAYSSTTILVTDYYNYCVRSVSLTTGSTSRYAGVCCSRGSTNGYRTSARFYYPFGIQKVDSSYYICDSRNKNIRKLSGNYVSTYKSLSYYSYGLSWDGQRLLYSFDDGISDNLNSFTSGSSSASFNDGSLSSARYSNPYDIQALTTKTFLVADYSNRAVRYADLSTQTVSTLDISVNGWTYPFCLMALNGSVYAGTNGGRIFRFPLTEIPVLKGITCSSKLTLTADSCDDSVMFTPPVTTDIDPSVRCVNCQSRNLTRGIHQLSYMYRSTSGFNITTCNQNVTVRDGVPDFYCPTELKLTLPADTDYVNATLQKPTTNCRWSKLKCIECPSTAQLTERVHEIKHVYKNLLTEKNLSCSYRIIVVKHAPPQCANTSEHIFLNTSDSLPKIPMEIGNVDVEVRLPVGVSRFRVRQSCFHTYNVHKWSNMLRKAEFQAKYLISCNCSTISTTSFSIIDANLMLHTRYMKVYCPECLLTQTLPDIKCSTNSLVVSWKTNVTGRQKDQIVDMTNRLKTSLRRFQFRYPHIDITVFNIIPMVVSPVIDETGLGIEVSIKSTCLDKGLIYDAQSDACVKAPCSD